jgi:hypothetical protein
MKTVHMLLLAALLGNVAVAATDKAVVVRANGGAVELVTPDGNDWEVAPPLNLTVKCEGVDCGQVSIRTPAGNSPGVAQGNTRLFVVDTIPAQGMTLSLLVKNNRLADFELMPKAVQPGPRNIERQSDDESLSLQELLTCVYPEVRYEPYNRRGNYAEFVTNVLGTVLGGPVSNKGQVIDEDDTVFVKVYVHPKLKPFMRVTRVSDTRTLGTLNIAGQGSTLERHSDEEGVAREIPMCVEFTARLTDFKAGEGKVRISAQIGDEDKELGTFAFAVSPIFHGMLSFGPLTSDVVNDSFKLVDNGTDTVIAPAEEGSHETRYAVWYTHFVWGGRDLEKPPERWYHRINPTLGLVTNDLDEHALAGVSVDFGAVVLGVGKHFARTTVLSRTSGLEVGDPFEGEADAIPTAGKWESSTYYSVSVDLRAAAALIKAAFSGGSD